MDIVLAILFTLLVFTGCKEDRQNQSLIPSTNLSGDINGSDGYGNEGTGENGNIDRGNGGGGDGGFIATYKPALAIRATGCIMCHARVDSSMFTDFGYGNDYFFGENGPVNPFVGAIYGNHAENWATASVWNTIHVPEANVSYTASNGSPVNTSLAGYLRSQVPPPAPGETQPTVKELKSLYIGAPTKERILQIAGEFPADHPQWKKMGSTDVTGLQLASGGHYVENSSTEDLDCAGDLVVNAVLFLNNLKLRTTNQGCRLYVTESVFIQGPIEFTDSNPDHNIQITSAKAIILGLGDGGGNNSLRHRLRDFWTAPGYHTRDTSGSTSEKLEAIIADGSYIVGLTDAAYQVPHGRAVGFKHILLNAPNFQSRYQGQFDGVIISEVALASLGAFSFRFDDVFTRAPILPLLNEAEILNIVE